jgi:hypothetical protein
MQLFQQLSPQHNQNYNFLEQFLVFLGIPKLFLNIISWQSSNPVRGRLSITNVALPNTSLIEVMSFPFESFTILEALSIKTTSTSLKGVL